MTGCRLFTVVWRMFGIAAIAILWLAMPTPSQAFGASSCSGRVEPPNWVRIECVPGFASAHDRISVFVRRGVNPQQPWENNLDYEDAIWFFDVNAIGHASLIIDFHHDGNAVVADLYDDGDGDRRVAYRLDGQGELQVSDHGGLPTVEVRAPAGWWVRDGKINFNLSLSVDGPVPGMIDFGNYAPLLRTDGSRYLRIEVRDTDGDGKPDVEWREARPPVPDDSGIYRTSIMVDTTHDEPPIDGSIFWPFLGSDDGIGFIRLFGARYNPPPIRVDWATGRITAIGESVASRGKHGNFFIYSIRRVEPGQPFANFENPFAFYNLANSPDGYADMSIRQEMWPANDPTINPTNDQRGLFEFRRVPKTDIHLTWDQWHRQQWDFEVGVAGPRAVETEIRLPEFPVRTVPFDQYPGWVLDYPWPVGTFVAVEGISYWNNEHIYDWTTQNAGGELWRYLLGRTDEAPTENFQIVSAGMRGEYTFHLNSQPFLAFSPIDHRLHLRGAEAGVWNLGDGRVLRYTNLGGEYLNEWRLEEDGREVSRLSFVADQLVLGDAAGVRIKRVGVPPALFTTLPPRNHDEWVRLRDLLDEHKAPFSGDDLEAMYAQFPGPETILPGGQLGDLRPTEQGVRFGVTLPNVTSLAGLGLPSLDPGAYLLDYRSGMGYSVQPLPPPDLELVSVTPLGEQPTALLPVNLLVRVRNRGASDVPSVPLVLYVGRSGESAVRVGAAPLRVMAGETREVQFAWTPPADGEWRVEPAITVGQLAAEPVLLSVARGPEMDLQHMLSVPGKLSDRWLVNLSLLALVAGLAGGVGLPLLRRITQQ